MRVTGSRMSRGGKSVVDRGLAMQELRSELSLFPDGQHFLICPLGKWRGSHWIKIGPSKYPFPLLAISTQYCPEKKIEKRLFEVDAFLV